ncbi:hypothetical protein V8C44DRAFT_93346 [Trichoderma aethiopicum]
MTVPFFIIGHACPVTAIVRVVPARGDFAQPPSFVHLLPAHLSLVCLVKSVAGCTTSIYSKCLLLHSPFSSFLSIVRLLLRPPDA